MDDDEIRRRMNIWIKYSLRHKDDLFFNLTTPGIIESFKQSSSPSLKLALEFSTIKVEALLATGASAKVYKAHFRDKPFAMKVLDILKNKEVNILKERDILASCDHRNIIKLYASFLDFEFYSPVLFLELCRCSLKEFYTDRVNPATTFKFMTEITQGVAYLHGEGIIHRDIKPDNILVNFYENITITDFGLAINGFKENPDGLYTDKFLAGTYGYIDFNVINDNTYSMASDIFAMGSVFTEMWTSDFYYLCPPEIMLGYSRLMDYHKFYASVFTTGRPLIVRDQTTRKFKRITIFGRQSETLAERLPNLFKHFKEKVYKDIYNLVASMVNMERTERPTGRALLQQLSKLAIQIMSIDETKWTPAPPIYQGPCMNITNNYNTNQKQDAGDKIQLYVGFTKIYPPFASYFSESNQDQQTNDNSLTPVSDIQNMEVNEEVNRSRLIIKEKRRIETNMSTVTESGNLAPSSDSCLNHTTSQIASTSRHVAAIAHSTTTDHSIVPNPQCDRRKPGRPKGSYAYSEEIEVLNNSFRCKICGKVCSKRPGALKHRLVHIR